MFKAMRLLKQFHKLPGDFRRIVFFSEGSNYWNTMSPLTEALISKGVAFSYLSMDKDDPGLNIGSELSAGFHIGSGSGFIYFMSMLKSGVVIMTTPGLQSLTLKRSPGVNHYVHLVHSPTGISFYRKYSFDHFDTVMCSGPHQIEELRKLEGIRGSRKKNLLETGLAYMDNLKLKADEVVTSDDSGKIRTILIAPTWGPNGALGRYGMKLVESLAAGGFNIIIRPHPQQLKSERALLEGLKKATAGIGCVRWDENPSGHGSMAASDIMISDLSGVIFDYAFVYGKPVITMDYELDISGFEQEDLKDKIWEREMSRALGGVLSEGNFAGLTEMIESVLSRNDLKDEIRHLRDVSLFNFGHTGEIAAEQLIVLAKVSPKKT